MNAVRGSRWNAWRQLEKWRSLMHCFLHFTFACESYLCSVDQTVQLACSLSTLFPGLQCEQGNSVRSMDGKPSMTGLNTIGRNTSAMR